MSFKKTDFNKGHVFLLLILKLKLIYKYIIITYTIITMVFKTTCIYCNKQYTYSYMKKHNLTKKHLLNVEKKNDETVREIVEPVDTFFLQDLVKEKHISTIIMDFKDQMELVELEERNNEIFLEQKKEREYNMFVNNSRFFYRTITSKQMWDMEYKGDTDRFGELQDNIIKVYRLKLKLNIFVCEDETELYNDTVKFLTKLNNRDF